MSEITIKISEAELEDVVQAYKTLQHFLEKFVSPNEIYNEEFLEGMKEAAQNVKEKHYTEVNSFDDFIQ